MEHAAVVALGHCVDVEGRSSALAHVDERDHSIGVEQDGAAVDDAEMNWNDAE